MEVTPETAQQWLESYKFLCWVLIGLLGTATIEEQCEWLNSALT